MQEYLTNLVINYQDAAMKLRLAGADTLAELLETKAIETLELLNEVSN